VDDRHPTAALSSSTILPVAVRRARPEDREHVLAFATRTWEGWDYIPEVWDRWIAAPDGVCLVCFPKASGDGRPDPVDADGRLLDPGRPIAFCRVALLSPTEAWLEGIRVDPAVRGRSVATALQVAELAWAAALGASVVRYTTGEDNEGSHRLGARHGFRRLTDRRSYGGPRRSYSGPRRSEEGMESRGARTGQARRALLEVAPGSGLMLPRDAPAHELGRWWRRVISDPTFVFGDGLYESRSWAFQELTFDRFARHARDGIVLAAEGAEGAWGLGILSLDGFDEGEALYLCLLVGEPHTALELASRLRKLAGEPIRLRLPDPDPPVLAGIRPARSPGGFTRHARTLHLFERDVLPLPEPDAPSQLTYLEDPAPVAHAPASA
jgi:RimJ/RimL family protein N-acetyltransferase